MLVPFSPFPVLVTWGNEYLSYRSSKLCLTEYMRPKMHAATKFNAICTAVLYKKISNTLNKLQAPEE